jgi:DNA-binding beta-propeller fold protein YncE
MPAEAIDGADKLRYLRRHWRLVTIAEIFADDIPPARVGIPEAGEAATDEPDASLPVAAEMQSWTAAASPTSTPKAVRITAQGDVLVLDTGLEQVQRFNEQGSLLATYSLPGLSGVEVLDLDVSPDGKRLYVVDATSRLRVISLVDEESTGGSESG